MQRYITVYFLFSLSLFGCQQSTGIQGNNNNENEVFLGNNNKVTINKNGDKKDTRNFKKFVPQTYLDDLPRIKYKSYIEAHKLWDTGITSQMHEGNKLLANKLREILINMAETVYTPDFFEGKTVSQYYDDMIFKLTKAAYDAQPDLTGSMYPVIAHGQRASMIDDLIVKVVKDVTEPSYFSQWKLKWDRAQKLGSEGRHIDIEIFTEL